MMAREAAFEEVFGTTDPPGKVLSPDDPELTVNWPGGGLHRYAPRKGRPGWHYLTHGLAQPLAELPAQTVTEPEAWSGLGLEYVLSTPEAGADWPAGVLLSLVRYQLFAEEAPLFTVGHTVPCRLEQMLEMDSEIEYLLGVFANHYPCDLRLPAGRCVLVHLVGITEPERARLLEVEDRVVGAAAMTMALRELDVGALTDPGRPSLTLSERFDEVWTDSLARAETNSS
jgi:hypothetical protein